MLRRRGRTRHILRAACGGLCFLAASLALPDASEATTEGKLGKTPAKKGGRPRAGDSRGNSETDAVHRRVQTMTGQGHKKTATQASARTKLSNNANGGQRHGSGKGVPLKEHLESLVGRLEVAVERAEQTHDPEDHLTALALYYRLAVAAANVP